jgi:hypothetical protein
MSNNPMTFQFNESANPSELSIYWDFGGAVTLDVDTPQLFKAISVRNAGLVMWENLAGEIQSFYCNVPGQIYPIRGKKIVTGTTASGIYWAGGM